MSNTGHNNRLQRTALRAAAEPRRYADGTVDVNSFFRLLVVALFCALLSGLTFAYDPYACLAGSRRIPLDERTWMMGWDGFNIVRMSGEVLARCPDGSVAPARRARFLWGAIDAEGRIERPVRRAVPVKEDGSYLYYVLLRYLESLPAKQIESPCIQFAGFIVTQRGCDEVLVPMTSPWPEEIILSCQCK
jgi:hypothetical protein